MSVTEQYLDSVNVPPPAMLPALWAPVGLRYHALHHLLPGVPYHGLGEAHRRIAKALPKESTYYRANHEGPLGSGRRDWCGVALAMRLLANLTKRVNAIPLSE